MLDKEIKRHDEKSTTDKQAHEKDMMDQKAMLDEITKKKDALASHESLKKTADDWKQKCIRAENEAAAARVPYATLESLQDENRFLKKIVDSLDACCSTERRIDDFAKHRVNDFQTMPRKSRRELIISWLERFDHRRASWLHGRFAAFVHDRNRICHDNGVLQVDHNSFLRVCDEIKQDLDQLDEDTRNAHLLL
ncbi:hypothetical protein PR003_g33217 [Phytophthora rubi]|uniref:Uncharacterized protein n=2 Tax=Phytophthora rubi TaxID=129364 RepID=A0A6A4AZT6_9STRA|nr:hypothetical protein PR003_g33217 [Phytophthora rubi]